MCDRRIINHCAFGLFVVVFGACPSVRAPRSSLPLSLGLLNTEQRITVLVPQRFVLVALVDEVECVQGLETCLGANAIGWLDHV